MGRLFPILFLAQIVLAVVALISCLSAEEGDIRALPRFAWVLIILFFPLIGSIAWFAAGKERYSRPRNQVWRPGSGFPEGERPGRTVAPDDNPDFLRGLGNENRDRERLAKWEAELQRREEELRKRDKPDTP